MSATSTKPRPEPTTVTTPDLTHIYCTNHGAPPTALCGTPRTKPAAALRVIGRRHIITRDMCVVCLDMAGKPCPTCGA